MIKGCGEENGIGIICGKEYKIDNNPIVWFCPKCKEAKGEVER